MRNEVVRRGLADVVSLPGFVSDRDELLAQLRAAHVHVFCHTTPESPRNLVEALISGCPIVGYHSDFAEELVTDGGGAFVAIGDTKGLVDRLASLIANRQDLITMTRQAAVSGKRFNDVAVFQHRSELIKKHL
jgi:glycosyltransferase involved in cell wall biosynthesis